MAGEDDETGKPKPPAPPAAEEDRTRIVTPPPASVPPAPQETPEPDTAPQPPLTPAPPPDSTRAAQQARPQDEHVPLGTIINNNYVITDMIQSGGMGEVYRGENSFTGDAVAIKIVLRSLAHDEKIAALFRREARILCQLSDSAIVRYHNFVHDQDLDRFCLIMEFIDGVPLSDHVKQNGPITVAEARKLIVKLAEGLGRAHDMDVVHRDLSPDNVMLRGGDVNNAVLIDFGIAKSTEISEGTLHGQFAGKFKYISPEQLGHYDGHVGPRTDIYGLALLMAAALIGEPIDMGSSVVEAVNRRREIPDLTAVPEELRPLLAHMLEPDPKDRPARMSDVVRLIRNPGEIPAKYGTVPGVGPGVVPGGGEAERTVIGGTQPPGQPGGAPIGTPGTPTGPGANLASIPPRPYAPALAPAGFQAPPVPGNPRLTTGLPLEDASASPFGEATAPPAAAPPPRRSRKRRRSALVPTLLVLVVIGGLGWFVADRLGLTGEMMARIGIAPPDASGETAETTEAADTPATSSDAPTAPELLTRETFLANFDAGPCTYATRITAGPNAGMLEGFAAGPDPFGGLPTAYEEQFGARPEVIRRDVAQPQCAAVAFAREIQAMGADAPFLSLGQDSYANGATVSGALRKPEGQSAVWLFLVSAGGGVYNLTSRLTEAGGHSAFGFGVNLASGIERQPQLVLAVTSAAPLISVAAARDGVAASELLPLVVAEIEGRGGTAGVAMRYFELVAEEPAPAEEPAGEADQPAD